MIWIKNNKFFGKYLPMFLSIVLVMITLFGWYVFEQSKRVSAAISLTNKENNVSTSFPTTTTGSLTWTAGARGIASVVLACPGGGAALSGVVDVTGGSETWTEIGFQAYNRRAVYMFLTDGTPTDGTLSITYDNGAPVDCSGAGAPLEMQYSVDQITGFNTSDPDDVAVAATTASGTSLNIGDVGTIDAGDLVYAAFGMENASDGLVPASGSTANVTREDGGNVRSLLVSYSTTDDTPGATWNSSGSAAGVAFIINVGEEAPVDSTNANVNIRGSGIGASLSDDFNRSDSDSLGANWTEANGDADISSNQLLFPTQGSTHAVAIYSGATTKTVNQYCKITVDITGQNNFYECVFRYIDASSQFYSVGFDTTSNTIQWGRCPDASASCGSAIQDSTSVTVDQGDIFGVTLTGTGSSAEVRVWKSPVGDAPDSTTSWGGDTSPDLTFTNNPPSPVDTGFLMGLASYGGGANAVTDNFLAGDIPGQEINTNPFVQIRGGAGGGSVKFR